MSNNLKLLMDALRNEGMRYTKQRKIVWDEICKSKDHRDAEEIYLNINKTGRNVSRATVFRTLKILLEANVICRLSMPGGNPRYSLSRVDHHHHTVCISCGRVGEFRASTIERLLKGIESDIPGAIVGHNIEFYIKCDVCV